MQIGQNSNVRRSRTVCDTHKKQNKYDTDDRELNDTKCIQIDDEQWDNETQNNVQLQGVDQYDGEPFGIGKGRSRVAAVTMRVRGSGAGDPSRCGVGGLRRRGNNDNEECHFQERITRSDLRCDRWCGAEGYV